MCFSSQGLFQDLSHVGHFIYCARMSTGHAATSADGKERKRSSGKRNREPETDFASTEDEPVASVHRAYANIDGYGIARDAKRQQREEGVFLDGIQFGEVRPESFLTALGWCDPQPGESFIDLGSGTGKAVLTAAAAYKLKSCAGVELLRPLHDAGVLALERCRGTLRTVDVHLECSDALAFPWNRGDYSLVFVSLTCFTDEMVEQIREGASKLPKGARLLVTSRPLDNSALRLIRRDKLPYGARGGMMSFLAYERI